MLNDGCERVLRHSGNAHAHTSANLPMGSKLNEDTSLIRTRDWYTLLLASYVYRFVVRMCDSAPYDYISFSGE